MKREIPLAAMIAPALLILAAVGYFLLVKPKQDRGGRLDEEIAQLQTQVDSAFARKQQPAPAREVKIRVADVFRLTKAIPDSDEMPEIMLELNGTAAAAGVTFVKIQPNPGEPGSGYTRVPINLTFEGNYFDLTDFLFRLRNLVFVRDGELNAKGRLFTLDSLDLHEGGDSFPQIEAVLTVSAYVYTPGATAEGTPAAGSTTTTTTTTTAPSDGTALGGS
ncbi:MAG TPA: type 4a pilus biogenesis protein PilO [Gaiellaceae bacterium]|nr:type 4a pilus biogenesis protein PilO [Gaiellaceae bacterium]